MDISQNLKTVLDNISNDINVINDKVESKQAEITSENKLDYSLISGAPAGGEVVWGGISGTLSAQTDLQTALNGKANTADIPTKTSDLTNDSGFVASSVMEDALSEKQDLITEDNWLPAGYVRMDLDPWQGDPEFTVENAVNMVHEEALEALSGVDAVSGALSGKQDAITNENKLSYSLISGAPETQDAVWGGITGVLSAQTDLQDALDAKADTADIPTSTSQLNNDSDFVDAGFLASMLEGYATTDYVTSQIVAIPLPQNVSELSNDADYQSGTEVQETVDAAVSGKQDEITNDNKLSYDLISGAPTVPTSTSQLTNDSDFVTSGYVDNAVSGKQDLIDGSHPIYGSVVRMDINHYEHGDPDFDVETAVNMTRDDVYAVSGVVSGLLSGKQDVITVENKLAYSLISGSPTVPVSTSQLTNDSNFVTSSVMEDALSGKQDFIDSSHPIFGNSVSMELDPWEQGDPEFRVDAAVNLVHEEALEALSGVDAVSGALSGKQDTIDDMNWLPATYVRMDIDHWQGDPDFDVAAAVNMTRDDVYAVSGVVSSLLSGKQDAITNDNKLDYGLLSGTPTIPLSTSQLTNDSDFVTSSYVDCAVSGKLNKSDYVSPYRLPYVAGANAWLEEDIGTAIIPWSDNTIIANDLKVITVTYTNNGDDHLVFPSLFGTVNENVIKTIEVWVKMAGNITEAQGIQAIVTPSSCFIVDADNFPTKLKGEATNSEAYTYHIFVIRTVPRLGTTYYELCYSHAFNTNLNI